MTMNRKTPLVTRYDKNPILTKDDVPYPVATVHNAGVVKHNGSYIMLFRSHQYNGRSIIGRADSEDGFSFKVHPKPFLTPSTESIFAEYEEFGIEDMRICPVEDYYLLTYSAYSRHGVRIALARTTDFVKVERVALITEADLRNVVMISYSPDLIHWGDSRVIMKPVPYHWDEMKIGPGAPPFKTDEGWLHIFHGVFETMSGAVYRLGVALHDLNDPAKIIGVSDQWILQPEDTWEITGYVPNVVFTCGAVPEDDGTIKIYWGGADTVMCTGTAKINDLVKLCLTDSRSPL